MAIKERKPFWESDDILDETEVMENDQPMMTEEVEEPADEYDLDGATAEDPITLVDAGDQLSVEAIIEDAEAEVSAFNREMADKHGDVIGATVDKETISTPGNDGNIDIHDASGVDGIGTKDFAGTTDTIEEVFDLEDGGDLDVSNLDEEDLAVDEPEDIMEMGAEETPDFDSDLREDGELEEEAPAEEEEDEEELA